MDQNNLEEQSILSDLLNQILWSPRTQEFVFFTSSKWVFLEVPHVRSTAQNEMEDSSQ